LTAETVKNRLLVRLSPESIRHAPWEPNKNTVTNGLDGTVSKRYKQPLKIQKHELVTDSWSEWGRIIV